MLARAGVMVEGWFVLRGDVAECVEVVIDGRPVPAETSVVPGGDYRNWGSAVSNFSARLDLSSLAWGIYKLEARLRGRGSRTHALSIPLLIQ